MAFYRRAGTLGIVSVVTLVSVLGSTFITMVLVYPFTTASVSADGFWYFLCGGIGVPLVIAPLATFFFARLLVLLDQSFQVMESLSTTDPLTGSSNRRGFFSIAEQNIRALRGSSGCSVGMVDLDNFKTLNDTHGHQAGDQALVSLAQELQRMIGSFGTVGRIGGDEFALLMIADPARLENLEASIIERCGQLVFTTDSAGETSTITLSASVGITQLEEEETFDDALARADQLLYAKKRSRRNRSNPREHNEAATRPDPERAKGTDQPPVNQS